MDLRAVARGLGLGRLRRSVRAADWWVAVPPRHLKDLEPSVVASRSIALTFDDGPDAVVTPKLLDVLESHSAKATFFMCGLAAKRHPQLVRAVASEGHTIGGHSWDHRLVRGLSPAEWGRQIDDTHALLADLAGAPVQWFRPPRGKSDRSTRERLRKQGVTTVLWSVHGRDWSEREPMVIADLVCQGLEPGAIVLLHDAIAEAYDTGGSNQEPTMRAVELILRTAQDRSLSVVSLDETSAGAMPRFSGPQWKRQNVRAATPG